MDTTYDDTPMQLQFWDASAKAYVSQGGFTHDAEHARMLAGGRPWRICRADRELTGPTRRYGMTPARAGGRPIEDVQRDYLRWAVAHGLTQIHGYNGRPPANFEPKDARGWAYSSRRRKWVEPAPIYTGEIAYISQDEQFAVTEELDDAAVAVAATLTQPALIESAGEALALAKAA